MPSRYVIRNFEENGYYHIFNRGVEKRHIFEDDNDYHMFKYYMSVYLSSPGEIAKKHPNLPLRLKSKNLNNEVILSSYCLMPNHFHLLLKQKNKDSISKFVKQLSNAYTFYFNKKYQRVGSLFQGRFKSAAVKSNDLLLHISRYIHLNPLVANLTIALDSYKWTSYKEFCENNNSLCSTGDILQHFPNLEKFKEFTMDHEDYAKSLKNSTNVTID